MSEICTWTAYGCLTQGNHNRWPQLPPGWWAKHPDSQHFTSSLNAHRLVEHVVGATHKMDHTLDVVITLDSSSLLRGTPTVSQPYFGDSQSNPSGEHLAVYFRVNIAKPESVLQVTFRKLPDICIPEIYQGSITHLDQHCQSARRTFTRLNNRNLICCRTTRTRARKAGNSEVEYSMVFKSAVRSCIVNMF